MDWHAAIERNREALRRVLAMLVVMAGFSLLPGRDDAAEGVDRLDDVPTLPRHLHRLVLRLLRPAEAAARRLVIVAARGLVVEVPPSRPRMARPGKLLLNRRNGFGTGVVIRPGPLPDWARALAPKRSTSLSLPLFDPLKRFGVRRRSVKPDATPRIRSFDDPRVGLFQPPPAPVQMPPSRDDPIDANRIRRRIDAVGRALDDLNGHAKRFALWQARRDARLARDGNIDASGKASAASVPGKHRRGSERLFPMRPGRPPGWRRKPDHAVYEILNEVHGLAVWARDDTS